MYAVFNLVRHKSFWCIGLFTCEYFPSTPMFQLQLKVDTVLIQSEATYSVLNYGLISIESDFMPYAVCFFPLSLVGCSDSLSTCSTNHDVIISLYLSITNLYLSVCLSHSICLYLSIIVSLSYSPSLSIGLFLSISLYTYLPPSFSPRTS